MPPENGVPLDGKSTELVSKSANVNSSCGGTYGFDLPEPNGDLIPTRESLAHHDHSPAPSTTCRWFRGDRRQESNRRRHQRADRRIRRSLIFVGSTAPRLRRGSFQSSTSRCLRHLHAI